MTLCDTGPLVALIERDDQIEVGVGQRAALDSSSGQDDSQI